MFQQIRIRGDQTSPIEGQEPRESFFLATSLFFDGEQLKTVRWDYK